VTGTLDDLKKETQATLGRLRGLYGDEAIAPALALLERLRNAREHESVASVAEAVRRLDPYEPKARRFYAQALIETGKVTAACDLLRILKQELAEDHPEALEAAGLLGRAYKQIFFDSQDRASDAARKALAEALSSYLQPYSRDPSNTWHGVNVLALAANARRAGVQLEGVPDTRKVATELLATLRNLPEAQHDEWYLPTLAEVTLGLGNWDDVESVLHEYVASPNVHAFQLNSTLRQFTKIWRLEADDDERGRQLVNILRARLLQLPAANIELASDELRRLRAAPNPSDPQLQAILGPEGVKTFQWWRRGLEAASSVGSIRQKLGSRAGTGFAVRAGDVGLGTSDEVLVLTNFHVVNEHGADGALQPDAAEVVFEGCDTVRKFQVAELVKSSTIDRCDAVLLRLDAPLDGIRPLPLAKRLPLLEPPTRVYVIGHPGGRDLAFSLQDNELLDHEGPPAGKPPIPGVLRVHYRAPTEGGSSGSPVFNASSWEVIALHHKGGKTDMPRLNGAEGTYGANEGVAIQSVIEAFRS
jgi:hypothetical protein